MIGGIEAIESDEPAEAGVDWREEDVYCTRGKKSARWKHGRSASSFCN